MIESFFGVTDMTTLPTPAELHNLIDVLSIQRQCDEDGVMCEVSRQAVDESRAALRQFATLIESAERGVTDEVVQQARWAYNEHVTTAPGDIETLKRESMRAALLAVAPHLALTKDKP
jgi:hypothetical protein